MRIIGGFASGRALLAPRSRRIRPTTDRVREALFSILGDIEGTLVVDGFAGTGALGCEALSRGARMCHFFDASHRSVEIVRENVSRIGAQARAKITKSTFYQGIAHLEEQIYPDLVFLDPPFGEEETVSSAFDALDRSKNITQGALVVLEQEIKDALPIPERFEREDERLYGRVRLTLWRCQAHPHTRLNKEE